MMFFFQNFPINWFSIIFVRLQKSTIEDPDYIAGVVSYTPVEFSNKTTPEKVTKENLKNYLDLIEITNGKNVDILVFPEATLNYMGFDNNRTALLQVAVFVPDIDSSNLTTPANDPTQSEIMREISNKAAHHQMYILINVVEVARCTKPHAAHQEMKTKNVSIEIEVDQNATEIVPPPHAEALTAEYTEETKDEKCGDDGFMLFNTNVVFDRYGSVISKYRKFNLFNEAVMSQEEKPELATFTSDFGIQFGHFICFDILFKKPAMK